MNIIHFLWYYSVLWLSFLYAVEKHPYESKLSAKEWHRVKQFIGVMDEEAECCGFGDKAEIELHLLPWPVWLETGMYYMQHLNSVKAAFM